MMVTGASCGRGGGGEGGGDTCCLYFLPTAAPCPVNSAQCTEEGLGFLPTSPREEGGRGVTLDLCILHMLTSS